MLHGLTVVADITMLSLKTSILILYIRMFGIKTSFRYLTYSIIAIQALVYLATSGAAASMLFLCADRISITHTFCAQNYNLVTAQRIFGVITDFLVLGMPIPIIWVLQMPTRRKLEVIGNFMTGSM